MKKVITSFMMIAVFVITSSFSTKDLIVVKNCSYNMYSANGTFLGTWDINVPDDMSCGSKASKALAVADYNVWH